MGDIADEMIEQMMGGDDEDETAEERAIRLLEDGFHTKRDGGLIEIKKMDETHLLNSIAYGKRQDGTRDYWPTAIPIFEKELERRKQPNQKRGRR